jgi:serine/threonine-protein kinase
VTDFKPGYVIDGKYTVLRILGQGGMGLVLEASRPELTKPVAIKVLLPALRDRADIAARFASEARTVDALQSPRVAHVIDVGKVDGTPFIVMERLVGSDLATLLKERGRLPVDEVLDLVLQACEPLVEAHALGIVHRDLKPANLFVTTTSDGPFVKVLDFGISKSPLGSDAGDGAVTDSADLLGSPLYMSPEQLTLPKMVDGQTDVWALGVILYELLTGVRPFTGSNVHAIALAILSEPYAPLSTHRQDLPRELVALIDQTLQREKRERLGSVKELAARLTAIRQERARSTPSVAPGEETLPEPPSVRPRGNALAVPEVLTGPTPLPVVQTQAPATKPRSVRWRLRALAAVAVAGIVVGIRQLVTAKSPSVGECANGATPACEAACAAHVPGQCQMLAKALLSGTGAPKDPARAAKLYEAECDKGTISACNSLGGLYEAGTGVPHDDGKAVLLYKRGCDAQDKNACGNLGGMHFEGHGVPKNEALGVTFFLRGCPPDTADVEPSSCLNLSIAYATGQGATQNAARAFGYAKLACDKGLARGCLRVATAKLVGDGAPKDVRGGLGDFDDLCTKGEPSACRTLVALYSPPGSADVPADAERVMHYVKMGCALHDVKSCAQASGIQANDSTATNAAIANAKFEADCKAGRASSCGALGNALRSGNGIPKDGAKAVTFFRKGCAGGDRESCAALADGG